jgi:hypothetical protein
MHLATPGPCSHAHIIPDDNPEPVEQPLEQSHLPHDPNPLEQPLGMVGMVGTGRTVPQHPSHLHQHSPSPPLQVPILHKGPPPWPFPPATSTRTTAQSHAYDLPSVPALIAYLHATAGYPVKSTWLAAVKRGAYSSWPNLTPGLIAPYCPNSSKTHKGHMAQPRQHVHLTCQPTPPSMHHSQSTFEIRKLPLMHLFTDDTGRFSPRALSGNQYIMVGLHTASNAILVQPFASKHDSHRIPAYNDMFACLNAVGAAPAIHVMDNEASLAFQRAIATNKCKLQLVPPHVHRRNAAERAPFSCDTCWHTAVISCQLLGPPYPPCRTHAEPPPSHTQRYIYVCMGGAVWTFQL